jgi:hypothetical protein
MSDSEFSQYENLINLARRDERQKILNELIDFIENHLSETPQSGEEK